MKSKGAVAMENKLEKIGQNNFMDNFVKTDDILLPVILLCMAMNNYLLPSTNYTCRQKKN